ncbi:hypothetical protein [Thalassomonas actiniarum]|uniref:Uncharacterized protein n=1 Tax=Thalassomonas actiniarum TaxID=485447 RepID=A0AAE9YZT3_9GAMM|nr:hypothetical protein [Thalassomonas actiniarum]WDE02558.1 hypothetical protein SG35_029580 [Thalassomonas actiniarum]
MFELQKKGKSNFHNLANRTQGRVNAIPHISKSRIAIQNILNDNNLPMDGEKSAASYRTHGVKKPAKADSIAQSFTGGIPTRSDKIGREEPDGQDQNTSLTSMSKFTKSATQKGLSIEVEGENLFSSTDYPGGFRWTQTIDTNAPLGGTSTPYVDPRPNDDSKPFYWTDAEHASSPSTFKDKPWRPVPGSGTTWWTATLALNGVDDAKKKVTAFDAISYGFTLDSAGTVTLVQPTSVTLTSHQSVLSSEFSSWTFS